MAKKRTLEDYAKSFEGSLDVKGYAFGYTKQDAMEEMKDSREYLVLDITDRDSYTELLPITRAVMGYTRADLAERLAVNPSTVTQWEKGNRRPSSMRAFRLQAFMTGTGVEPFRK